MMFWMLMAVVILLSTLLQAQLPGITIFGGMRLPILCCVVLYYALNHRSSAGLVSGFSAGLLMDVLSMVPLGYSILIFVLMALAAGRYRKLVLPEAPVTAAFFGGLAGFLYPALLYGLLARESLQGVHPLMAAIRIAGGCITGAVSAPLVFLLLSRLHRALNLADKEEQNRVNA